MLPTINTQAVLARYVYVERQDDHKSAVQFFDERHKTDTKPGLLRLFCSPATGTSTKTDTPASSQETSKATRLLLSQSLQCLSCLHNTTLYLRERSFIKDHSNH